jgi:hypothetical protein
VAPSMRRCTLLVDNVARSICAAEWVAPPAGPGASQPSPAPRRAQPRRAANRPEPAPRRSMLRVRRRRHRGRRRGTAPYAGTGGYACPVPER